MILFIASSEAARKPGLATTTYIRCSIQSSQASHNPGVSVCLRLFYASSLRDRVSAKVVWHLCRTAIYTSSDALFWCAYLRFR